jgi:molybdate transport system regulatory protein
VFRPRYLRTQRCQMTPKTRLSVHFDSEFGYKIETKQIALLETIQRHGSITGTAKFLGQSYRGTQIQIDAINKALQEPAVNTHSGGLKGGGAALTPLGIKLVELYRAIEERAQAVGLPEREALHRLMRPKEYLLTKRVRPKHFG